MSTNITQGIISFVVYIFLHLDQSLRSLMAEVMLNKDKPSITGCILLVLFSNLTFQLRFIIKDKASSVLQFFSQRNCDRKRSKKKNLADFF